MRKSTHSRRSGKSEKPYDGFLLTAYPTGRWCKRRKGGTYYFGLLADWKAALEKHERDGPYIAKEATPPETADGEGGETGPCTLRTLCNTFLESRRNLMDNQELTPRNYRDSVRSCERMTACCGGTPRGRSEATR
jgi:hypothetical protein